MDKFSKSWVYIVKKLKKVSNSVKGKKMIVLSGLFISMVVLWAGFYGIWGLPSFTRIPMYVADDDLDSMIPGQVSVIDEAEYDEKESIIHEEIIDTEPEDDPEIVLQTMISPVEGDVVREFGWYLHPVYEDWRYSSRIGLAARSGDPIHAVSSGKVDNVTNDGDKISVTIIHSGDVKTTYSNFSEVYVSTGDKVDSGRVIGTISEQNEYIYFGVNLEGEDLDPGDYF